MNLMIVKLISIFKNEKYIHNFQHCLHVKYSRRNFLPNKNENKNDQFE